MKLGIIGTGKIVADALFAIKPLTNIEKVAIFARAHSEEKGKELASTHGIQKVYTDYEELLRDTGIDTVYIGNINSVHYEYAKKALLAGKHVILEKPFTGFLEEALDLQRIAIDNQLIIFEAITVLHNSVFDEMKKNLSKLGPIRMMMANYSQYSSRYEKYLNGDVEPAFDPACYGGTLFDINVYNIHYCVGLFGRPLDVDYYPNIGHNGIDTSGMVVMKYDGFSCVCTAAKDSDSACFVSLQGEKGWMRIDGKPNAATALTTLYVDETVKEKVKDASGAMVRASITENFDSPILHHRMTQEFKDFADMIDHKKYEEAYALLEETIDVMYVLENARKKAGIEFK